MRDPRNILLMRLGGIGEILAITPALRAVRVQYPRARITLLGEVPAVDVIRGLGMVDEILEANAVYRAHGWRWIVSPGFYSAVFGMIERLTSRKYDLFVSFQHLYYTKAIWKPLLVSLLSRATRRVGFDTAGRGFFLTDRVADDRREPRHLLYRNRELLAPLGIVPGERVEMAVTPEERIEAARLAREWKIDGPEFVVGVTAGSSRPATQWMTERFIEVLRDLQIRRKARIVLVGAASDRGVCAEILRSLPECVDASGRISLGTLAALMPFFDLFLSNDTGPIHIAHAFGVPTVGIYRPGEWPIWGSYREKNFEGVSRPVPCAPCYVYRCAHHTCLKLVEPRDVLDAAERVLAEGS